VIPTQPATAAVLVRLLSTGLPVGDARKPVDGGWTGAEGSSVFRTYLVLYPINHNRDGPNASIADRSTDPELRYQVTAIGVDRRSAETAADKAAAVLGNHVPLTIAGRSTVLLIHETSVGVTVDESVNPPLFIGIDRYRLDTSHL
jgi:hypothetical protein